MSGAEALIGARIRRIDALADGSLAIGLHAKQLRGALLIGLSAQARGVGWIDQRPAGRVPSRFVQRLDSYLEAGRVTLFDHVHPDLFLLHVARRDQHFVLEAVLRGQHGNAVLRAADGSVLVAWRPARDKLGLEPSAPAAMPSGRKASTHPNAELGLDLTTLRAEGAQLLEKLEHVDLERARATLERAVRSALLRARRRLSAIEADLERATQVHELRHHASLVLAQLHALPPHCSKAELLDYSTDPPATIVLNFDPSLGPKLQAEAWFRRARKLERGAAIATTRAQATRASTLEWGELAERVASAVNATQLAELAFEARELGASLPSDPQTKISRRKPPPRLPYRAFAGAGKRAILVGRGPHDNDRLTLDHARLHDLWLHTRDNPGAHVVVPLERDEACPPDLLRDAAMLAAHFSQARGQSRVDITYTERRFVHKPRKAPPGRVSLLREKVFRLELDPARLKALLESERPR